MKRLLRIRGLSKSPVLSTKTKTHPEWSASCDVFLPGDYCDGSSSI